MGDLRARAAELADKLCNDDGYYAMPHPDQIRDALLQFASEALTATDSEEVCEVIRLHPFIAGHVPVCNLVLAHRAASLEKGK
jgi:hypothetical protein